MAAHFSPIMIEGALVLPPGTCGMIEASATRSRSIPLTRNRGSRYRSKWDIDDSDGPLLFGLGIHRQYLFVDAEKLRRRDIEFFAANIRNPHTRRAYARACGRFFAWCEDRGLTLTVIRSHDVAAWIEELQ